MKDTITIGETYILAIAADTGSFVQARIVSVDSPSLPDTVTTLTASSAASGKHLPVFTGDFTPPAIGTYLITFIVGTSEESSNTEGVGRLVVAAASVAAADSVTPTGGSGESTTTAVVNSKRGVLAFISTSI